MTIYSNYFKKLESDLVEAAEQLALINKSRDAKIQTEGLPEDETPALKRELIERIAFLEKELEAEKAHRPLWDSEHPF